MIQLLRKKKEMEISPKRIRGLIISSNVGSLFESPKLIPGWCIEISKIIQKHDPNFIKLGFQEIGGKDSAFMENITIFQENIIKTILQRESPPLYSTGLLYEPDLKSPDFTALASLFFLEQLLQMLFLFGISKKKIGKILCNLIQINNFSSL